jgi:hypothetical protein
MDWIATAASVADIAIDKLYNIPIQKLQAVAKATIKQQQLFSCPWIYL